MKKYCLVLMLLNGCSFLPVTPNFPAVPAELKTPCPELYKLAPEAKLSDLLDTVSKNYAVYHECRIKNEAWIQWYDSQSKIFNELK